MTYWDTVPETKPQKQKKYNEPRKPSGKGRAVTAALLVLLVVFNIVYSVYRSFMDSINFVDGGTTDVVLSEEDQQELDSLINVSGSDIETAPEEIIKSNKDVEIILLVGSDSRFGGGTPSRSDTIMLGVIDRIHKKIKLISILRDCYAQIPGYGNNKINNAFFFDSTEGNNDLELMRSTIAKNLGIDTEKFVIVDFSAFEALIDAIGGVTMEVTDLEADYMCHHRLYGLFPRYEAGGGTYHMDGAEALNYARMRKVEGQSDFDRTERQRKLLSNVMQQAISMSYLDMAGVVKQMLPYVTTNYAEGELLGLAFEAITILQYDIVQFTVPIGGTWKYGQVMSGGWPASVISVNFTFNAEQLQKFIFEDDMTYTGGASANGVWVQNLTLPTESTTTTAAPTDSTDPTEQTVPTTTATAAP